MCEKYNRNDCKYNETQYNIFTTTVHSNHSIMHEKNKTIKQFSLISIK